MKSSMEEVYEVLVKIGAILEKVVSTKEKEKRDCYCHYHATCTGHTIQECEDFIKLLQARINQREIEFSEEVLEESSNVITDAKFMERSSSNGLKPLTIFFKDDLVSVSNITMHQPRLTVEVPSLFPYMDNKMVPWNYNCNYVNEAATTNISSIGSMT